MPTYTDANGRYNHRDARGRFAPRPMAPDAIPFFVSEIDAYDVDGEMSEFVVHHGSIGCPDRSHAQCPIFTTRRDANRSGIMCPTCVEEVGYGEFTREMVPPCPEGIFCVGCDMIHKQSAFPTMHVEGYKVRGSVCRSAIKSGTATQRPYATVADAEGRYMHHVDPYMPRHGEFVAKERFVMGRPVAA